MRLFGIDAGFCTTGFSVVDFDESQPTFSSGVLHAECFIPERPNKLTASKTLSDVTRVEQTTLRLIDLCLRYLPDVVVVELPTGGAKSSGAMRGMAYATAMTCAALFALKKLTPIWTPEFEFITPNANKKGATGLRVWNVEVAQGKWEVFVAVKAIWPNVNWPVKRGKRAAEYDDAKCWAIADSLACVATYLRRKGVTLPEVTPATLLPQQPSQTCL